MCLIFCSGFSEDENTHRSRSVGRLVVACFCDRTSSSSEANDSTQNKVALISVLGFVFDRE